MSHMHHWNKVYGEKSEQDMSWHQDSPAISFDLLQEAGLSAASSVIDIGGGTSRIIDGLLALGLSDLSVLDLSENALICAQRRLKEAARKITWITADITTWRPDRRFDFWHDRAVFHFLTTPADRAAYIETLSESLVAGGHAIIATFSPDGPEKCSGLPVQRYTPETLAATLGPRFALLSQRHHLHQTPWGAAQSFQFSLFRVRS